MKKLLCVICLLAAALFVNTADAAIGSPMRRAGGYTVATVSVARPVVAHRVGFHGRHFGHRVGFHGRHFGHRVGFHGRRFGHCFGHRIGFHRGYRMGRRVAYVR